MKLRNTLTISVALALTGALPAQFDASDDQRGLSLSCAMDDTGVDLQVSKGYADGTTVILYSLQAGSHLIPLDAGGGEILLGADLDILVLDNADGEGNNHWSLPFDTKALADAGIRVFVQAISVNSTDWPGVPGEGDDGVLHPVRVSNMIEVDFYMEMRDALNQDEEEPQQKGSPDGESDPDGTDGQTDCRCPAEDKVRGTTIG